MRITLGGAELVDAPPRVAAAATEVRNRAPFPITAQTTVSYRWTAGGKVLRSVTVTPSDGRLSGRTASG